MTPGRGPMPRHRRLVRRLCLVLLPAAATVALASAAWGYWPGGGAGTAAAGTGTLVAPASVTASAPLNSGTVTVGWTAGQLGTGQAATGYVVTRVRTNDSATFPACGSSAATPVTTLTCADTGVVDGDYRYRVLAVFHTWSAMSSDSNSVHVVNDTTLPTASVTSITPTPNGAGWNNSSPVVVHLAATAGAGVASISYRIDSGATTVVPGNAANVTVTGTGIFTVTYSARDNLGVTTTDYTVLVRIDTSAPAAPSAPVLAAASDSGSSSSDGITTDTTPTVSGTAEAGSTVTVYDGTTAVGSAVATGGSYTITTSALPSGVHTLTAKATDVASNVSPASTSTSVTVDTTAPAAPSAPVLTAASDSGSSATDRITNVVTPTLTGTAEDGATIQLFNGATLLGTTTATGGVYSVTSSTLTTGVAVLTVKATDPAGNLGPASSSTSVTIDITAPSKPGTPVLATASDSGRSNSDKITFVTTPVVTGTTTAGTTVVLYDGGTTVIGNASPVSTAWTITSATLGDAVHTITAKAADVAGNLSPASSSIAVTVDTTAPAAPSAPVLASTSDSGRSTSDRITNKTTPVITGTNESKAIVTLYDGSTQVGQVTTTTTASSTSTTTLADGSHPLTATATDVAGNVGPASTGTSVTVDTVAPAAPSTPTLDAASDTGVSSSDQITKTTAPSLSGTAEANALVNLYDSGVATGSASTATVGGTFTGLTGTLTSAVHPITAKATDVAGNVSSASGAVSVTVDTVAPTVTVNQATGQADPTTSSPVQFTATFSEAVTGFTGSSVTVGGTALATTAVTSGTGPAYTVSVSGMSRTGTVLATIVASKVQDLAGNNNTASTATDGTVTFTDNVAPVAPSTPVLAAASDSGVSSSDAITKATTLTYTGTAEVGSTVKLYDGATQVGTGVATTGAWSILTSTLTNGTHTITATATDVSGNTGPASSAASVIVDTVAPTVTVNQASGQADPTTGASISFTVTFSEAVSGFTGTSITFGGTAGATTASASGTGPTYPISVSGMTRTGTVIPTVAAAKVTDLAGNSNTASTATDGTVTYNDLTAPVVAITGFTAGSGQTAVVSGTAGTGLGDNLTVTVVLCTVNVFPCVTPKATLSGVAVNPATGAWTVTSASLGTTPTLYAKATQTDLSANTGASAVAGAIAIP